MSRIVPNYVLTVIVCAAVAALSVAFVYKIPISKQSTAPFATQPTWIQDFTASTDTDIDPSVWRVDTNFLVPGYNDELQAYTASRNNIRQEPGVGLVIEARHETYIYLDDPEKKQYEFTSGRIDTRDSFAFEYGKIEARIKLPSGAGTWPAFWLLSTKDAQETQATSPPDERLYMKTGEIDIMEHYGDTPNIIEATAHTYNLSTAKTTTVSDATEAFHTYGVEITPDKLTWTLDGHPYQTLMKESDDPNNWPFGNGNTFYIILNLAMGGPGGTQINHEAGPWRMEVQNISYYPYKP